jgi:hypothetical protein
MFFLLLRLWDEFGLLDPFDDFPSTTNKVRPTRDSEMEVEDERLLKDFIVISIFTECFVLFVVSFNARVLFVKKTCANLIDCGHLGVSTRFLTSKFRSKSAWCYHRANISLALALHSLFSLRAFLCWA